MSGVQLVLFLKKHFSGDLFFHHTRTTCDLVGVRWNEISRVSVDVRIH